MSSPKGWPTQEKDQRLTPQFVTVEPVRNLQHGLSVLAHQFVYEVGTDAVEAGSTEILINATTHVALAGDVIQFTSGALSGREVKVYSVATNSITLAEELPSAPVAAVTFKILRHKYPIVDSAGSLAVSASFAEAAVAADGGALPAQVKVIGGYDGSVVQAISTDSSGNVQTNVENLVGVIDANNTTSTPLAGGATFTGAWTDLKDYNSVNLGVFSNVASATDGLKIQYSADGITVHHQHLWTFAGGTNGSGYQLAAEFRYFRVQYVNGATAQASFQLISNLKSTALFPSSYRASTTFTNESQVILTKGVIVGETTGGGGGYVAVKVNPSGALTTENTVTSSVLPTGAATESTLSAINTKTPALGQAAMAASTPVVIASNQSAIPASQSGTWNITNISGTISLPTGAATAANQTTEITHLSNLAGATLVDNAAFTDGTTRVDVAGFILDETAGTALTENDAAAARIDSKRSQVMVIEDATTRGQRLNITAANAMKVDGSAVTQPISGSVGINTLSVVDLFDANILDTSTTNIPGSAGSPVQVVATLAATSKSMQILDTTGAFIGLFTGAAAAEVLRLVIGPGSDQTIEHTIAAGTRISLRRLDSTAAISSGVVAINFLG